MRPALGSSFSLRSFGLSLVVVAAVGLSACGGSDDSSDEVASLGATADDVSTETTVAANDQEQILAYTECLREQGLEVADPTFDADGNLDTTSFANSGIDFASEEYQAAQAVCGELLEGVNLGMGAGGGDPEALQDASLAFTECLREQGLEVDDLDLSSRTPGSIPGGGSMPPGGSMPAPGDMPQGDPGDLLAQVAGLDPADPEVAAAIDVCEPELTNTLGGTSTTVAS